MPISYPSGSFDSWPGFLVCPSPNRNSFPFHESTKPLILDEDHEVADLTEEEIKALEKKEEKLQKQIKKRKLQAKDKAIRERAKKRARNLLKKPTI